MMVSHPAWGNARYEATAVPGDEDPDGQVAAVIGMMRGYVLADYRTPVVAAEARQA